MYVSTSPESMKYSQEELCNSTFLKPFCHRFLAIIIACSLVFPTRNGMAGSAAQIGVNIIIPEKTCI